MHIARVGKELQMTAQGMREQFFRLSKHAYGKRWRWFDFGDGKTLGVQLREYVVRVSRERYE
jgi:hypothetical protein